MSERMFSEEQLEQLRSFPEITPSTTLGPMCSVIHNWQSIRTRSVF
ncbi:hypothetical protein [Microtetraspora malaysiensis]